MARKAQGAPAQGETPPQGDGRTRLKLERIKLTKINVSLKAGDDSTTSIGLSMAGAIDPDMAERLWALNNGGEFTVELVSPQLKLT